MSSYVIRFNRDHSVTYEDESQRGMVKDLDDARVYTRDEAKLRLHALRDAHIFGVFVTMHKV